MMVINDGSPRRYGECVIEYVPIYNVYSIHLHSNKVQAAVVVVVVVVVVVSNTALTKFLKGHMATTTGITPSRKPLSDNRTSKNLGS